jgi:hypothetical protein
VNQLKGKVKKDQRTKMNFAEDQLINFRKYVHSLNTNDLNDTTGYIDALTEVINETRFFFYQFNLVCDCFTNDHKPAFRPTDRVKKLAFLKIVIAYEEIHEAARVVTNNRVLTKINTIRSNPSIATKIRSNERLKNLLLTHTDDNALKNNLTKFYKQNTNDIMALACAIRNIYAHGEFTAGGAGLVTIEDCKQMRSIADELLNYCDELFTNCADELERIANER